MMVVHHFEFLSWGLECSFIYLELYRVYMRLFEFAATLSMEKHNFSPVWNKWWQHVIFFFAVLTIIFFLSSNSYSDKTFSISLVTVLLLACNCCMAKHPNHLERYRSQVVFTWSTFSQEYIMGIIHWSTSVSVIKKNISAKNLLC